MLWKIMILFLCAMVLVGMVGKVLFPGTNLRSPLGLGRGADRKRTSGKGASGLSKFCPDCGKPQTGGAACGCRKGRA